MTRYCTECGAPVGEPHIRSTVWKWKKKDRAKDKKINQENLAQLLASRVSGGGGK